MAVRYETTEEALDVFFAKLTDSINNEEIN